jgi:hypothetical protein
MSKVSLGAVDMSILESVEKGEDEANDTYREEMGLRCLPMWPRKSADRPAAFKPPKSESLVLFRFFNCSLAIGV